MYKEYIAEKNTKETLQRKEKYIETNKENQEMQFFLMRWR